MRYIAVSLSVCILALLSSCRPSPQKLLATADKFHANKKYKEAEILYQKVLIKDKKNADAYYKGGLNYLDEGKAREASQYLRRAVDLQPTNTDAEAKLAEIYMTAYLAAPDRTKQLRPEIDDLRNKILQHDPNSFEAMRIQAVLYLSDRKPDEALKVFEKANALHPHSRELIGWYAQSLLSTGHPDQAGALVNDMIAHDKTWAPGYDFLFLLYRSQKDPGKAEAILREHMQNDPHSAAAIVNLANYLAASNHPDEAESTMKLLLADPKAFPRGHQMLGDFYLQNRKFDPAVEQYKEAASSDPAHAVSDQERIVYVNAVMGKKDEALKMAKSLADKNPKDIAANEMYASLLVDSGLKQNVAQSVTELTTLSKNNPSNSIIHLDLSKAYLASNDADKALSEALEALQDELKNSNPRPAVVLPGRLIAARVYGAKAQPARTLEQVNQVLAVQPGNPEARLLRDQALIALNQADQAIDDLNALVKQYPRLNEARLSLAQVYMNKHQYQLASDQYSAVWNGPPKDLRGYMGLQGILFATGKQDEAVTNVSSFVAKNPTNPQLRYELLQIQTAAGETSIRTNPAAARTYFEQASANAKELLKTSPNSPDLWLRLGSLQQILGQIDPALASFEQASHADPKNTLALIRRGMLLAALNRKKEAADLYNQALGIDPNNPTALNNLAFINAEQGINLDQAMNFAERAKQQQPKSPDVSDTLGYVYLQKNLSNQALEIFRQNVQDQPQNPTFRLHLAMALLKKGDKQGAKDEAQKAMKMAPPAQQPEIRAFVGQIG